MGMSKGRISSCTSRQWLGRPAGGCPYLWPSRARRCPGFSLWDAPLFTLVPHISPQGIQLKASQLVVGQQQGFDLFNVLSCLPQPLQDGLFLDPLDPVEGC